MYQLTSCVTAIGANVERPTTWAVWNDLFHEQVPVSYIAEVFEVMASWRLVCRKRHCEHDDPDCYADPGHTFVILTKRSERMKQVMQTELTDFLDQYAPGDWAVNMAREFGNWPLPNVVLGVSVEDQATADDRIPWLLRTPAARRLVSVEPMLGSIEMQQDLTGYLHCEGCGRLLPMPWGNTPCACGGHGLWQTGIDWVIAGGETGPGARPMHPDWARSLRDQCQRASVPFYFKHWGEWLPAAQVGNGCGPLSEVDGVQFHMWGDGKNVSARVGKACAGRLLDGQVWDQLPWRARAGSDES